MLRERIVWLVALLAVGGIAFYGGQTLGVRAGEQNRAQAAQQFFSERGGQGGGPGGGAGGFAGRGGQGGGVFGTVSAVSGNIVTVTTRNGRTTKVELAANGTVRKQVDGQMSDIVAGEQITAVGAQNGDTFEANSILVGGQAGGRNSPQATYAP
jgi:hypothetical protein